MSATLPLPRLDPRPARRSNVDDALHLHEARALDQHRRRRARARSRPRPPDPRCARNGARPAPNARAACADELAQREQPLDACSRAQPRRSPRAARAAPAPSSPMSPSTRSFVPGAARARRSPRAPSRDSRCRCRRSASRRCAPRLRCSRPLTPAKRARPRGDRAAPAPPAPCAAALAASALRTLCSPGACSTALRLAVRRLHARSRFRARAARSARVTAAARSRPNSTMRRPRGERRATAARTRSSALITAVPPGRQALEDLALGARDRLVRAEESRGARVPALLTSATSGRASRAR